MSISKNKISNKVRCMKMQRTCQKSHPNATVEQSFQAQPIHHVKIPLYVVLWINESPPVQLMYVERVGMAMEMENLDLLPVFGNKDVDGTVRRVASKFVDDKPTKSLYAQPHGNRLLIKKEVKPVRETKNRILHRAQRLGLRFSKMSGEW